MCESITKLTGPKLGQQLLKVFEPIVKPPIESIGKPEASYKQHCDSLTLLEGVDIKIHPIIKTFLLHQMVSKLGEQPRLNSTLGIPLSGIVMQGYKDYEAMVQLLEMAITEYTNDPSQHDKPRVVPKVIKALTDAEMANQVCADFREVSGRDPSLGTPAPRQAASESTPWEQTPVLTLSTINMAGALTITRPAS